MVVYFALYHPPVHIKITLLFYVSYHNIPLKALGKPHLATLNKTYGIRELLYQLITKVGKNHQHGKWFYFTW